MTALVRALFSIVFLSAVNTACGYGAQTANQKVCTQDEGMRALDESDGLKDWDAVYRSFKRFGHCDNGAVAEGYDDSIIRLLVGDWNHFDALAHLAASDKAFEQFILGHIDELASQEQLKAIANNAKSLCPSRENYLCERIKA